MNGNAVLVVEDDEADILFLRTISKHLHWHIVAAKDLDSARESVEKYPKFRIVFVDLKLGQDSGMPFIRWIQAHHPKIPVVVLTGALTLTPELMNELIESGVQRAYQKPLDKKTLADVRNLYDQTGAIFEAGRATWSSKTNWAAAASFVLAAYALYTKQETVAAIAVTQGFGLFFAGDKKDKENKKKGD